ncbi:MAG: hypothetical protein IJP22_04070 [Clostridia bacterium]|nr:hypothetical protein [Clostridia bacterium]
MQKRKMFSKMISVFALVLVLVSCLSPIMANAAFSGGSGTRNDPYLIKTAKDLYNMRDNLSASYKLAATIDMKGFKTDSKYFNKGFVPIGDDSTKPFTGSFTCDLGSDGLPLYAILNLNIYNKKGEIYNHDWYSPADYPDALGQKAPYFYQTALFGTTSGANISNIYVLNAEIYSSVVGQHNGRYADPSNPGSLISYKEFIDTQSTAILIGEANNTTVTHCAATGEVNGKSSRHGGLIGSAQDSNISNSYADVNIDTGGCWGIGNFIGRIGGMTTVSNCFSLGKLNASLDGYGKMGKFKQNSGSGAGGFIGNINEQGAIVQNCWSAVELTSKTKGNNFLGTAQNNASFDQISNCFCYGVLKGRSSVPGGTSNKTNCFISNATKGLQPEFNAASPAEITKYFLSVGGWVKGDKYPVLASTNVVKDAKMYVPGEEREKAPSATTSSSPQTQTTASNTQSSVEIQSNAGVQSGVTENTSSQVVSSDNTQTDATSSNSEGNTENQTTVETIEPQEDEVDIIQLILIAILAVMIIGISGVTVVMIYNTIRTTKKGAEDSEMEDEQDE